MPFINNNETYGNTTIMKKLYCFETVNNATSITLDEFQENSDIVTLKIYHGENVLVLQLDRDDFNELCNMRYRLDFARDVPAQLQELTLVAA